VITTKITKHRESWVRQGESVLYEIHVKTWYFFGIPYWSKRKYCKIPWHVWASAQFLGGTVDVPRMFEE